MVSGLDSGSGGLGSSTSQDNVLCFWTRHFTLIVKMFKQASNRGR